MRISDWSSDVCSSDLDDERRYFAESRPCGLILFRRNCGNPEQIRTLIADFKASVASDEILVLIDQEGGRVERLKPPHWLRSEERRVGKKCVRTCRYRWSQLP